MWSITAVFRSTTPPDIQIERVVVALRDLGIVLCEGEERKDDWVRWTSEEMVDTRDMWRGLMDSEDGSVTAYSIVQV